MAEGSPFDKENWDEVDLDEDHPMNPPRGRGVLTRRDREFLTMGEELDLTEGAERQKRQRIRDRLHQSILDFPVIKQCMDVSEIQKAFEPHGDLSPGRSLHIMNALDDVIAVLYLASLDEEVSGDFPEGWFFERVVSNGIEGALVRTGVSVEDVSVSIDIQRGERLEDITGDLSEQPPGILTQLYQGGEITSDEYADAMSARTQTPEADEE